MEFSEGTKLVNTSFFRINLLFIIILVTTLLVLDFLGFVLERVKNIPKQLGQFFMGYILPILNVGLLSRLELLEHAKRARLLSVRFDHF